MRQLFLFFCLLLPIPGITQTDKTRPDSTNAAIPANEKSGGSAKSASLQNRRVIKRAQITDSVPEKSGKVVIEVCVDNTGTVVSADYIGKGSTTSDPELRDKALNAAKKYRFAPCDQALQCGDLTFNFMLKPKPAIPSDLVFIKGGTFQMGDLFGEGDKEEQPVHTVTLSDFYLGKTEVTFESYDAYCTATGLEKPRDSGWGRGQRPVINVQWYDAVEYCNWRSLQESLTPVYTIDKINKDSTNRSSYDTLKWTVTINSKANGYRLPTEAEWEYAARAVGSSTGKVPEGKVRFGHGKDIADPAEINFDGANDARSYSVQGIFRGKTVEVGTLSQNSLGLSDMSGNVWEWCWDWYDEHFYANSPIENPSGPSSGYYRVCRGGSWDSVPVSNRVVYRQWDLPFDRLRTIGFRVARNY